MKVLVIGANNSGKGTLVRLLSEKTGLKSITCSSVLKEERLDIATGKLLPDEEVLKVMYYYLKKLKNDSFILDGFPRTVLQDLSMNRFLFKPDLIIVLNISEEEVINRAVGRRVCEKCFEIYNLNGFKLPKKEGVCDKCNGKLIHREDDKEETVRRRYSEYVECTEPIVDCYKSANVKTIVWEFDATEPMDEIVNNIADYINYMME